MKQKDYKAKIWVICLLGTQDEKWVDSLLSSFNRSKVNYYNIDSL